MKVVVRVGGSVVGSPLNAPLITKYVELLKDLKQKGHQVVAVVGGGSLAREFIKVAAELGLQESKRDWAAIHVSRLFAQLFTLGLGDSSCGCVPVSVDEAESCLETGKVVVLGGLRPGMTTDSVAALVGEKIKADLLVKGSNVDGIYNKDPRKFSDAKRLDKVSFGDLGKIFEASSHKAANRYTGRRRPRAPSASSARCSSSSGRTSARSCRAGSCRRHRRQATQAAGSRISNQPGRRKWNDSMKLMP